MSVTDWNPNWIVLAGLIFVASLGAGVVSAEQGKSLEELAVAELKRLRSRTPPSTVGTLSSLERRKWSEYSSNLERLTVRLRKFSDEDTRETLLDTLNETLESYHQLDDALKDARERQLDELQALREDSRDDPEDYPNETLLNRWYRVIRTVNSLQGDMKSHRHVHQLVALFAGYTARGNRGYRADLMIRYLDFSFPAVVSEYLQKTDGPSVQGRVYRGLLGVIHREVQSVEEPGNLKRDFLSMIRYHGSVLRSIARGGRSSNHLSETVSTIERIGRSLTGDEPDGETYRFLE